MTLSHGHTTPLATERSFKMVQYVGHFLPMTNIFTARRYAKRGICRCRVSVRLSVCVSVPFWNCIS